MPQACPVAGELFLREYWLGRCCVNWRGSFVGHEPQLLIWGSSQFPKGYRLPVALFGRNSGGPTQDEALPCPRAGREVGCG